MAHNSSEASWRRSPDRLSPRQTANGVQRHKLTQHPAYSQVEVELASDLQIARGRRISPSSSSLANALGEPAPYASRPRDFLRVEHSRAPSAGPSQHERLRSTTGRSSARTSVAGSPVAGPSASHQSEDTASKMHDHINVFSVGGNYRQHSAPTASSSKPARPYSMSYKAVAARKRRRGESNALAELNDKLPHPWHQYEVTERRVVPEATAYITHLQHELDDKTKKNEESVAELRAALVRCTEAEERADIASNRNDVLQVLLRQFGVHA